MNPRNAPNQSNLYLDCLPWPHLNVNGYGYLYIDGKSWSAHRYIWTLERGPIPSGLTVDHLCRNRACINVEHMELVTRGENVLRGTSPAARAYQTGLCLRGHPLDGKLKNGWRYCKTCRRMREHGLLPTHGRWW